MPYYRICPFCGAHLDPGERCDCRGSEKTVRGAANTTDGNKAEQKINETVSASHDTRETEEKQV